MNVEKVFRPFERELKAYWPLHFRQIRELNQWPYEEEGRLCLEFRANTLGARLFSDWGFQGYLREYSERNGEEVVVKVVPAAGRA